MNCDTCFQDRKTVLENNGEWVESYLNKTVRKGLSEEVVCTLIPVIGGWVSHGKGGGRAFCQLRTLYARSLR